MNLNDTEIALVVQVVFPFVVAFVAYLYRVVLGKFPENQRAAVESTVSQVVQAVEQAQALVPGQVKKEYAVRLITNILGKAGIKAAPELIDTLIESCVYQMNQRHPSAQATAVLPQPSK